MPSFYFSKFPRFARIWAGRQVGRFGPRKRLNSASDMFYSSYQYR